MLYVVQADYENGETLFVPMCVTDPIKGKPVLSVDEAHVFGTEHQAQEIADLWNDHCPELDWEVAEF